MKKREHRKTKFKWSIPKILSAISVITSLIFIVLLKVLNVLPFKFFMPIMLFFLVANIVILFFTFIKKIKNKKSKMIVNSCAIILSLISIIGSLYFYRAIRFMGSFGNTNYKTENYSVIVLNNSSYNQIEDIKGKELGMISYESEGKNKAQEHINSKIKATFKDYETPQALENALLNKDIEVIVVEDSYKTMLEEINSDFSDKTKTIYTFSIKIETESIVKSTDVTKNAFSVYISGIDTYGKISSVSRSDVNMVATINPTTHQILLISIPRDYYVQLHGTTGYKDKLTHAGIYGIDMSVKTIEDLLGIDINYYAKVNFSSVIKIVDVLDGIDVYSEYTFNSYSGFKFYQGYNHMNGEQALDFARTRKAFATGDRQRGKNQQAVIAGLIKKASSSAIITKYNSLLNSIEGSFQTNLTNKEITDLAKFQLNEMPSWTIKSVSLDGSDAYNYTYSYGGSTSYVMVPYKDSIKEAQDALSEILGGAVQESSYSSTSNIKTPSTSTNNTSTNNTSTNNTSTPDNTTTKNNTTVSLTSNDITVTVGDINTIKANVNNSSIIKWSTSDSSVATVVDGKITALKAGTAIITASVDDKTATCIVRVNNPLNAVLPENDGNTNNTSTNTDVNTDTDLDNKPKEDITIPPIENNPGEE